VLGLLVLLAASIGEGADLQSEGLQALEHEQFAQAEQIFAKIAAQDPTDYTALS
jgi:Flp pilus assembly protein TadD